MRRWTEESRLLMGYDGFKGLDDEKLLASVRKCYGFGDTMRMELLKYSENLTYRLRDGKTGEKYVLRVFRPGYHRDEELEGELVWIHRLTLDTDIRTADVLPGRDGAFVQSADGFHLALFRFIEGYELTELSRNEWYCYMEKIG
ncbi:MAG: hypothetical protein LUG54_04505, partial [Clostridiales bacterium]|nr:hypothetical protein [Clostridiales bacterium]